VTACLYPGCHHEATCRFQPKTRYELLADIQTPGLCQEHEFFAIINKDAWKKAGFMSRATMEIQAMEDLEISQILARAAVIAHIEGNP
jgi:hypothetical protein